MKKAQAPQYRKNFAFPLTALALLLLLSVSATAQSTDIDYPTFVRSNEVAGTIAPRDVGDPRATRYYYSFTGTPGDLIVTVESRNLDGDVDVFTAGTLRPLAKISLYAVTSTSGGSKTIFLKNRESLILRVEARPPNDNEGSFTIHFDGTFEPISRDIPDREPVVPTVSSAAKGKRVTSAGAIIEEPKPEVTEAKPAETTPAASTTETPAAEKPEMTTETAKTTPAPRPRTPRVRRPGASSTRTPRTGRQRPGATARRNTQPAEQPVTAPVTEPASGPRLIIETRDGMRVERFMTTVRRVTVENGLLVVIGKDGKVERQPMSNVLRMAIEP